MAPMETVLSAPEVFIALVVAAHAAVLALRLSISLYEACSQSARDINGRGAGLGTGNGLR